MLSPTFAPRRIRAFSLVEILVVTVLLVLIGGGLAYFYVGGKGKNGQEKKTPISVAKATLKARERV